MFSGLPDPITEWQSKSLPNYKIKPPFTVNHGLLPKLIRMNNSRIKVEFKGSCLS